MWDEFPAISTAEWQAAIRTELGGGDYDKKLLWRSPEGLEVRPFYRREDLPEGVGSEPRYQGEWRAAKVADIPAGSIRADLLHEHGATAVEELASALAQSAGKQNVFVFAIGSNYFFEIAKLRAARQLWARISKAPMVIWSRTSLRSRNQLDPAESLMRCTTEAMSAIFGGCDVLVVEASSLSEHLAESLPRVLGEEAHFNQVADPGAGSYYIENLTGAVAAESWKAFQAARDAATTSARITE